MSKPREKLQVEQMKASLLHSFQAAATGAAAALQPALQRVSPAQQQRPGGAAWSGGKNWAVAAAVTFLLHQEYM